MKAFNFIFLLLFLALPLVAAQQETFQFNKQFDLKRGCFNEGFFCNANFVCNITLIYPNGNILINNQLMTIQGSFRNITISQSQNNQLGIIEAITSCNNGTDAGGDTFEIEITGDGLPSQVFPTQFSIILLGFLLIAGGSFNDRFNLLKVAGSILIMVMGVLTLYPGYSFINYSNLMGQTMGVIFIALGFYFMIEHNFSRDSQSDHFNQYHKDEEKIVRGDKDVLDTSDNFNEEVDDGRIHN